MKYYIVLRKVTHGILVLTPDDFDKINKNPIFGMYITKSKSLLRAIELNRELNRDVYGSSNATNDYDIELSNAKKIVDDGATFYYEVSVMEMVIE